MGIGIFTSWMQRKAVSALVAQAELAVSDEPTPFSQTEVARVWGVRAPAAIGANEWRINLL